VSCVFRCSTTLGSDRMALSDKAKRGVYPAASFADAHVYESAASAGVASAAAPAAVAAASRIRARMVRVQAPHCALQPQAA
jgi:hypothetical protein